MKHRYYLATAEQTKVRAGQIEDAKKAVSATSRKALEAASVAAAEERKRLAEEKRAAALAVAEEKKRLAEEKRAAALAAAEEKKRLAEEKRAAALAAAEEKRVAALAAAKVRKKEAEEKRAASLAAAEVRKKEAEQKRAATLAAAEAKKREAEEKRAAASAKAANVVVEKAKPSATISLGFFGFGQKNEAGNDEVQTTDSSRPAPRIVSVAPRGVPTLYGWRKNRDFSVTGLISGSPSFDDGESITSSPLKTDAVGGAVVETTSGSK